MRSGEAGKATAVARNIRFLPAAPIPENLPKGQIAISDMANAFGVTHRTLHFYEEKGLLSAARIGLMRVYGHAEIQQMAVINVCREIGMPVAVIQELMEQLTTAEDQEAADRIFHAAVIARKRELVAQQSTGRRQMQQICELLDFAVIPVQHERETAQTVDLSPLELNCLSLMAEGFPSTRIARILDMDHTDILALEADIIHKFDGHNRFQAVAKAVLLDIIPGV